MPVYLTILLGLLESPAVQAEIGPLLSSFAQTGNAEASATLKALADAAKLRAQERAAIDAATK